jgi:rSAM/selenodomain-associated transferase 1
MPRRARGHRVLGLFAKEPRPGHVKTRLAAETSPGWAAEVAEAFLRDAVLRLGGVDARRVLAFAPAGAEPYFTNVVGDRFALTPQAEGDLGRRLAMFFREQFAGGAGALVVVGSDSPTVPLTFVEEAFERLADADVVLGPATDGGYYLIGTSREVAGLFDDIAWGSSRVLCETVNRVASDGGRLAVLPPWYDVDTLNDWQMLRGHVAGLRRAGQNPGVPDTERLL